MNEPSNLKLLDLSNNLLSEEIPDCWMYWNSLEAINLGNNNFTGTVPSSLGSLSGLQSLHLPNNHLSGELPSSLQNCTESQIIDLDKNEFSGNIPMWLGECLVKLIVLVLNSNNFGGSIPSELCNLSSLQILDLAHNKLSGTIPQCFSNFSALAKEKVSYEATSVSQPSCEVLVPYSQLPDYAGHVEEVWLIIKGNELEFIYNLNLLMSMDLSDDDLLSGEIPQSMSKLTFLSILHLSYNNLSGSIPLSTQLQSFDASSFMGNPELCGPPLTLNCTEDGHGRTDEGSVFQMEQIVVYSDSKPEINTRIMVYRSVGTATAAFVLDVLEGNTNFGVWFPEEDL
ncbi:receptor-like protein EIX2 [Macadamia integrifolia]|uniref:receptor-like protein EIX2 n=1 Tax=Macadamia integrifolia TaxID=60698 RepID=UPI001C5287E7|nr:receptor-like protein EIX2 [Macadamia integrifolia]